MSSQEAKDITGKRMTILSEPGVRWPSPHPRPEVLPHPAGGQVLLLSLLLPQMTSLGIDCQVTGTLPLGLICVALTAAPDALLFVFLLNGVNTGAE